MSQHELIIKGQIAEKKQERVRAVIAAKAALRSLANAAAYALPKPVEDINTAELAAHLQQLTDRQEEVQRLDEEIRELSY